MKKSIGSLGPVRPLTLAVLATSGLLCAGAFLVVLGIFNEALEWDIFSPRVEAVLWGVFFSSVSLGGFGAVLSVVLGIHQIAGSIRDLGPARPGPGPSRRRYAAAVLWLAVLTALVVVLCAAANRLVLVRRIDVFSRMASAQMARLGPKLALQISRLPGPSRGCPPREVTELLGTLQGLSFVRRVEVYLADPGDDSALWRYSPGSCGGRAAVPKRFFTARESEKAIKRALEGDLGPLEELNREREFTRYFPVPAAGTAPRAVLRIEGNPRESFRDYPL